MLRMPTFSYTARLSDGALERGTVEAKDIQAARVALRAMETDVIELEDVSPEFTVTEASSGVPISADAGPKPLHRYFPLTSTLRLYAGWLLAWYVVIYGIGSYQFTERVPGMVPFLDDLFLSPLIFGFTAAAFLFLLLSSVHRIFKGRVIMGVFLTILGIAGVLAIAW